MALAPEYYTADMVRALPEDGQRYECVHGELLVTPAPSRAHQRVVRGLMVALVEYCERFHHGEVLSSPAALSWEADSLVQPDVFVVAAAEAYVAATNALLRARSFGGGSRGAAENAESGPGLFAAFSAAPRATAVPSEVVA